MKLFPFKDRNWVFNCSKKHWKLAHAFHRSLECSSFFFSLPRLENKFEQTNRDFRWAKKKLTNEKRRIHYANRGNIVGWNRSLIHFAKQSAAERRKHKSELVASSITTDKSDIKILHKLNRCVVDYDASKQNKVISKLILFCFFFSFVCKITSMWLLLDHSRSSQAVENMRKAGRNCYERSLITACNFITCKFLSPLLLPACVSSHSAEND